MNANQVDLFSLIEPRREYINGDLRFRYYEQMRDSWR